MPDWLKCSYKGKWINIADAQVCSRKGLKTGVLNGLSVTIIFGAGGQLGRELRKIMPDAIGFAHSGSDHAFDIQNLRELENAFTSNQPDVVINTSAMTDVDKCETDKSLAYSVNTLSVLNIARLCRKYGSRLYHISTDYVFNGVEGNYKECAVPDPINYYGFSKAMGDAFAYSYENSTIVRTSGIYGYKMNFPKFVYESLKAGKTVNAVKGYYSPIHAGALAHAIAELVEYHEDVKGIINVAGVRISRMQLAHQIAIKFGLDAELISEIESFSGLKARRPYDSSLDISYSKGILKTDFFTLEHNMELLERSIVRENE
ncbi:MAG: NAD(P)-dependent oxidoreductase [Thermoplasmatales archaeon]